MIKFSWLKPNTKLFFIVFLAIGFALRLMHALVNNYGIKSDEVMQYLEQGHVMVFGYGLVFPEQALAMRTVLVPAFVALWLWLCKVMGLANPTVYVPVVKTAFVVLSMAVPVGMYRLAKAYYGKTVALASLVFACMWYELVYWAHKPLTSITATSIIFLYLALAFKDTKNSHDKQVLSTTRLWVMGFVLALVLAVRIQYAPFCFFLFCYMWFKLSTAHSRWQLVISSFVWIMLLMGVLDWITFGYPFQSTYNNLYYNVVRGMAASFGVTPFYQYFVWLERKYDMLLWLPLMFALWRCFVYKQWLVVACFLAVIIPLSAIGHKEPRFIFAAIPFYLMMTSFFFVKVFAGMYARFLVHKHKVERATLYSVLTLVMLLSCYGITSTDFFNTNHGWEAMKLISQDDDATGVHERVHSIYRCAGYYYLHKAIPLYDVEELTKIPTTELKKRVSHIISREGEELKWQDDFFKWKQTKDIIIWKRLNIAYPQTKWNSYIKDKYSANSYYQNPGKGLTNKRFKYFQQ